MAKNASAPNSLLYKDKNGRRIRPEIKGPTFREDSCHTKIEFRLPGPGAYNINHQQVSEKTPSYSIPIQGLISRASVKNIKSMI